MGKIDDTVPELKFLPALVITIIFGIALQLAGDWKLMLIAGALGALFVRRIRKAFFVGFFGIGLAWSILFVYLTLTAQAMDVANVFIGLLGLYGMGALVIVISVFLGALLGGFGGMLGRALFEFVDEFLPSDSEGEQAPPPEPEPVEEDLGRFNATKKEEDRYKLKVPTLRNIALTHPYMHDGFTNDLKEVVKLIHSHWVPKLNRKPLSSGDVVKLVEMLKSNTGKLKGKQL